MAYNENGRRLSYQTTASDSEKPSEEHTESRTGILRAVVKLADARKRRAELLLRDEEPADEEQERRAWNDRERAS